MRLKAWIVRQRWRGRTIRHFVLDCTRLQSAINPIELEMDSREISKLLKTEVCRECLALSRRPDPGYKLDTS